jgi:hypothetical protein
MSLELATDEPVGDQESFQKLKAPDLPKLLVGAIIQQP